MVSVREIGDPADHARGAQAIALSTVGIIYAFVQR